MSSIHCLGMCGPLVGGMIPREKKWGVNLFNVLSYHSGRILIYGILGLLIGWIGKEVVFPHFQQTISIVTGGGLLIWFALKYTGLIKQIQSPFWDSILQNLFGKALTQKGPYRYFVLGSLNGILPCGMVYIAMAGALAAGTQKETFIFMILFGLGTLPMLLAVTGAGFLIRNAFRSGIKKLQPVILISFAFLLMLRGLNLGVPYLSPKITHQDQQVELECCVKK